MQITSRNPAQFRHSSPLQPTLPSTSVPAENWHPTAALISPSCWEQQCGPCDGPGQWRVAACPPHTRNPPGCTPPPDTQLRLFNHTSVPWSLGRSRTSPWEGRGEPRSWGLSLPSTDQVTERTLGQVERGQSWQRHLPASGAEAGVGGWGEGACPSASF